MTGDSALRPSGSVPTELVARLESASAGSRLMDAQLAVLFSGDPGAEIVHESPRGLFSHVPGWYRTSTDTSVKAPEFTTSLDAALALAERVLPEASINGKPGRLTRLSGRFNGTWEAASYRVANGLTHEAVGATPALALCIAILKATTALEAKSGRDFAQQNEPNTSEQSA